MLKRRLLIRPGAIGDCILALPELESHCGARTPARSAHTSHSAPDYTEVWVPRPVVPLIQFADRTRAIADTRLDLVGVIENFLPPELADFTSVYSWYGSNNPAFRAAVRDLPFTFFPALPINMIGVPRIRVPAAPVENVVVIHPFSGSPRKNWPLDFYRALATALESPASHGGVEPRAALNNEIRDGGVRSQQLDSEPLPVRFCAGPDDPLAPFLHNAIRIDNLYDLACFLSTARLFIGNDSGITHLAAAVGVPTIAIFLSTDPGIWAPRGDHVTVLANPTIDAVLHAARSRVRSI